MGTSSMRFGLQAALSLVVLLAVLAYGWRPLCGSALRTTVQIVPADDLFPGELNGVETMATFDLSFEDGTQPSTPVRCSSSPSAVTPVPGKACRSPWSVTRPRSG